MKVYLSSTYQDLEDYRTAALKLLRRSEYTVIAMEDYVAAHARPLEKCLRDVASCDLYICIVGFRYGFIPTEKENKSRLSITELEYEQAQKFNRPTLLFLLSEPTSMQSIGEEDREKLDKLSRFKRIIGLGHVISFIDDPSDLTEKLAASLHNWQLQAAGLYSLPNLSDTVDNKYVKVLNYIPGEKLKVRWYPSPWVWLFASAISALVITYFLLPMVTQVFMGDADEPFEPVRALLSAFFVGGVLWLSFAPPYVSFNLRNSWITAKVPGAWQTMPIQARQLRLTEVQRRRDRGKWRARLSYGNLKIAETDGIETREEARRELEPIALAINHAMGLRTLGD